MATSLPLLKRMLVLVQRPGQNLRETRCWNVLFRAYVRPTMFVKAEREEAATPVGSGMGRRRNRVAEALALTAANVAGLPFPRA